MSKKYSIIVSEEAKALILDFTEKVNVSGIDNIKNVVALNDAAKNAVEIPPSDTVKE